MPGQIEIGNVVFYFQYDKDIRKKDYIVEPYFEENGDIVNPVRAKYYWDVENAYPFRSDHLGRVEYIRCLCVLRLEGEEN